jgi:DNA-binding NtrC family response regulator
MPLETQAKLLRVLETRQVTPLGSVRPRAVDVRFVAATNRDLDALVRAGKFRDDLLFRIAGMTIAVPPLRDRQDEIPELAARLLQEECARASTAPKRLTEAAIHLLVAYGWPGNLRELRSAMERAVLLTPGDVVDAPQVLLDQHRALPSTEALPADAPPAGASDDSERDRIVKALEQSGGNQKEAAALLGITRRALMYRMDRLGLKRPRKRE